LVRDVSVSLSWFLHPNPAAQLLTVDSQASVAKPQLYDEKMHLITKEK
jgi:hypothetical protein